MSCIYGVDISEHNGAVDFKKLKNDKNSFVIIRAGFGNDSSQKDIRFESNYENAKTAGFDVGAYWYSYALSVEDAKKEAQACLKIIKGKKFEYPIWFDMEDADGYKKRHGMPSHKTLCAICNTFCQELEKKGYFVGMYASQSWFANQLKEVSKSYDKWVASWGRNDGNLHKVSGYRIQQYTSSYKLNGRSFDRNVVYDFHYPKAIMGKHLNGFS